MGNDKLRIKNAIYPRIKKQAEDNYLMFYQDGQIGWNIYYSVSSDLVNWSLGFKLFNSVKIDVDGIEDDKCYSTCDAIVLDNGELVESGTHAELVEKRGVYYKLLQLQTKALAMRGIE